jgi:hypothetical protein
MSIEQCFDYLYGLSQQERREMLLHYYKSLCISLNSELYELIYTEHIIDTLAIFIIRCSKNTEYSTGFYMGRYLDSGKTFSEIYNHNDVDNFNSKVLIGNYTFLSYIRCYKINKI